MPCEWDVNGCATQASATKTLKHACSAKVDEPFDCTSTPSPPPQAAAERVQVYRAQKQPEKNWIGTNYRCREGYIGSGTVAVVSSYVIVMVQKSALSKHFETPGRKGAVGVNTTER